jgi:hypothetical protein
LPLTRVLLLLRIFNFKLFKTPRTAFTLSASIIGHKHTKQTNKHILRTKHQATEKLLKNALKDRLD